MPEDRPFQVRFGVEEGAQGRDAVRRLRIGRAQAVGGQVADIAVAGELHEGEALGRFVEIDRVAEERLGVEPRAGIGLAAQRRGRRGHAQRRAGDVARRRDAVPQAEIGDMRPGRSQPGIEGFAHAQILP